MHGKHLVDDARHLAKDKAWTLATAAAVAAAGVGARVLMTHGWEAIKHEEPPKDPGNPDVEWREAVTWAVASGVAIGLFRLAARRGTSKLQHRHGRRRRFRW